MPIETLNVRPPLRWPVLIICMCAACAAGCGETEQISRYPVSKETVTPVADGDDVQQFSGRPQSAWFLKVTGPTAAVGEIADDFRTLVESTSIESGTPAWTLPEGWSQESGSGMRFATLRVEKTDPPLELSIIRLPYAGGRENYLLENINRWRGQVGLASVTGADWIEQGESAGEIDVLTSAHSDATLVDLTGKTEDLDDARMLAAILLPAIPPSGSMATSPASRPTTSRDGEPLTYETPDAWQPGRKSMMRVAAFEVTDGDKKVEITVIPAGGNVLDNVNRWRGQVGLEGWTDEQMQSDAEIITIDGEDATYVSLRGAKETILAAILPGEPQSWFFKLTGDPKLAEQEQEHFKAFLNSVKFKK